MKEQKVTIENQIIEIKREIEKQSLFSKADKIALFHRLFIGNELAYAKHWVGKHTLKTIITQYDTFLDSFTMMLGEIVEDNVCNKIIVDEVMGHPTQKILILSERIEHLNILWHMLDAKGVDAILLHGGLSAKEKRVQFVKTDDASIILSTSPKSIVNYSK